MITLNGPSLLPASSQTSDRLEILSLVSGQAASTIEKARLVNDLSKTNENLQRSQAALEASNRTLETRIAERTASLQAEVKEKERAQAEMRKSKEVAESATAQKSQFLANMSHEVRLPEVFCNGKPRTDHATRLPS